MLFDAAAIAHVAWLESMLLSCFSSSLHLNLPRRCMRLQSCNYLMAIMVAGNAGSCLLASDWKLERYLLTTVIHTLTL